TNASTGRRRLSSEIFIKMSWPSSEGRNVCNLQLCFWPNGHQSGCYNRIADVYTVQNLNICGVAYTGFHYSKSRRIPAQHYHLFISDRRNDGFSRHEKRFLLLSEFERHLCKQTGDQLSIATIDFRSDEKCAGILIDTILSRH